MKTLATVMLVMLLVGCSGHMSPEEARAWEKAFNDISQTNRNIQQQTYQQQQQRTCYRSPYTYTVTCY